MITYIDIAHAMKKAFPVSPFPSFDGAVKLMKNRPEMCEKISCFNETLWSVIQDCLNGGYVPNSEESFVHACALLEAKEDEK
jgi:hypothetical protein